MFFLSCTISELIINIKTYLLALSARLFASLQGYSLYPYRLYIILMTCYTLPRYSIIRYYDSVIYVIMVVYSIHRSCLKER